MISGAYLGDKLSPLSETTVLTSQMVGVDVHEHIKRQAWTSIPAFVIAFVVLLIVGVLNGPDVQNPVGEELELNSLNGIYNITPLALLPLLLLGYLSIRRVPATLALLAAALFAGVLAAFLQPSVMHDFGGSGVVGAIKGIWLAMANGFSIDTGIGEIDSSCPAAAWTACSRRCG